MRQQFTTDERGVSEVIGAILVFGLLIALLAMMQTYAIPSANEEVEYNHNQDVQSDLVNLQEASSRTAAQGISESTSVRMGTTYPSRMVFFNPTPPAGQIRTVETSNVEIGNIEATDSTVNKYFTGTRSNLETKRVEYRPSYNEYDDPPTTVVEYGTLFQNHSNTQIVENEGTVVDGNRINLVFYEGDLSRTSGSTLSVETKPASAPARTVGIESADGSDIEIALETRLSEENWRNEILDGQFGPEGNVESIDKNGDVLTISLDGSKRYNLRMAKIGVGNNIPDEEPRYVVEQGGMGPSVIGASSNTLPFEVRDRYNNPVGSTDVNISVSRGTFDDGGQTVTTTTNENGQPNVRYTANQAGLVTVNVSLAGEPPQNEPNSATTYDFDPEDNPEDLQFRMSVDPSEDTEDPEILSETSVERTDYQVCGGRVSVLSGLTCALNADVMKYAQVTIDYEVEDHGPGGLDSMKIEVTNTTGDVRMTDVLAVTGGTDSGVYQSPQIIISDGWFSSNEPDEVTVTLADRAGNSYTETYSI